MLLLLHRFHCFYLFIYPGPGNTGNVELVELNTGNSAVTSLRTALFYISLRTALFYIFLTAPRLK